MKRIKSKWGSKTALTNQIKCAPATTSPVAAAMRKAAGV